MAEADLNQHLEMMIHKRSRCEDWVASVALSKQNSKSKEKKAKCVEVEYDDEDEFSNICDSSESVKRRVRKTVNNQKLSLNLMCEWSGCKFTGTTVRSMFVQHVAHHIPDLAVLQKPDETNYYQCLWEDCAFETADSSGVKRHVNYHAYHTILKTAASELHNIWEFSPCMLSAENRNWLPDLSFPFECNVLNCQFETDNYYYFLDHVNAHIAALNFCSKKEILCVWRGCNKFKSRRKTGMKIHMKCHTGEKSLACPTCGALFATNTKYMDHCNRKTPCRNESNRCQYCFRYYSNERLLRDHMRYHINSHKCSFCEMTFSTPAVLANHVRYKHLDARPFKCNECSFSSVSEDDCNAHMFTHEAEPRYQCQADGCNFSCRAEMTFKNHFRSVHLKESGPVYCCHLCDKKYNRGPCLGMHLRMVHKLERLPGHSRFRYMENKDGYFRLQVERYESLELDNVDTPITSIEENNLNYVLKAEDDSKSCKKFTITVDESESHKKGALIAIDELDEDGNVIHTSTVHEELIGAIPNEILFVDVNDTVTENPSNEKKEFELNTRTDDYTNYTFRAPDSDFLFVVSNSQKDAANAIPATDEMSNHQNRPFGFHRKKRRKIELTDLDGVANEVFFKSESFRNSDA